MNSSPLGNSDRNSRKRVPAKASGPKWSARRLFLEALEPRQMMTIVPIEGTPFGGFDGNYYPPQHSEIASIDLLSGPIAGDPLTAAKNYLKSNLQTYGLTTADIDNALVSSSYTDQKAGNSHVYFQQMYNGLPVADAHASVNMTKNGRVITAAANFVGGLSYPNGQLPLTTTVNRGQALAAYADQAELIVSGTLQLISGPSGPNQKTTLRQNGISNDAFSMQLQYVAAPSGGLDLAWQISAETPDRQHWFDAAVAAAGPRAGEVIRVTDYTHNASYEVFPLPQRSPLDGGRVILIDPQNFTASPFGWHDVNGIPGPEFTDTEGNNVRVQDDIDGNNTGGTQVNGGPTLDFRATFTTPAQPITNLQAGILQAFYLVNVAHDVTFNYGFNEVAGNFQFKNYTAGINQAFDFDPVIVDVQDSSTSAGITVLPDGLSPRMELGINNIGRNAQGPIIVTPARDEALDATVVLHEFFHGVTNRLTGGPSNASALTALQSAGLDEGSADWFAAVMTMKPTDNRNSVLGLSDYYFPTLGDRRAPYSFDLSINPRRFSDFNAQGDASLPFPGNLSGNESHNAGEIWASALIDLTVLLTERYGFDPNIYTGTGGNNIAMQLVIDALKLQPPNPSFIEARDALIAADLALTDGDNFDLIWQAMARRGIGASANSGGNNQSLVVAEAFDMPVPLARVEGVVFNDANGNAVRDGGELPLSNWTVYVDANKNGILDAASEKQFQTGADGAYHFNFTTDQTVTIRQIVQPSFTQTLPKNNAPITVGVSRGNIARADFGNKGLPGQINGVKFTDSLIVNNGPDVGEPRIAGVVIYLDLNYNGQLNVLEPSTTTNAAGRYSLKNVPAGTYIVREVLTPGFVQTFPGPALNNAHLISVASGQVVDHVNFANNVNLDFGDAPNSYGTNSTSNGPQHGILPGFSLGAFNDADNGLFAESADASRDAGDDGVTIAGGTLIQGGTKSIDVATTSTGSASAGRLHAWVDFNGNGVFEASEKVISNRSVPGGTTVAIPIPVPATAKVGRTFARFRYGFESDLSPTGPSVAGEVEDYAINIVADFPTAVDDPSNPNDPNFTVRAGESAILDLLANDPDTSNGPPHIVPSSLTLPSRNGVPTGSTVTLNADGTVTYSANDLATEDESFTYRVSDVADNSRLSNVAVVRINVIVSNPRVLPDTYTIAAGNSGPIRLGDPINASGRPEFFGINYPFVLDNDKLPGEFPNSTVIFVETVTTVTPDGTIVPVDTFQIYNDPSDPANAGRTVTFTPPSASFTGTIIGRYRVDDSDPLTNAGEGLITVQVVNGLATPAATHRAQLLVEVRDAFTAGNPEYADGSMINVGDLFLLRVRGQDLRTAGTDGNRGVDAGFLDLLYASEFAEPVLSAGHPLGFNVVFDGNGLTAATNSVAASPAPTETSFSAFDDPLNDSDNLDASPGFYSNQNAPANLIFTSGILAGQSAQIVEYTVDGDNRTFRFGTNSFFDPNTNLPLAPSPGDSFRIEFQRYSTDQNGAAQSPAAGQIDEVGGAFTNFGSPTGQGIVTIFTVLMRATGVTPATRPLVITGDPADDGAATQVIVAGDPQTLETSEELNDDQVFLRPSTSLVILPEGEGEFTNLMNPVDVNGDNMISTIDAVIIINHLNSWIPGQKLSTSSSAIKKTFIDVNRDNTLSTIDALLVINRLRSPSLPASSTARSEGESSTSSNSQSLSPVLNTVLPAPIENNSSSSTSSTTSTSSTSSSSVTTTPTNDVPPPTTTPATTTTKPKSTVDQDAADDIFSRLFDLTSPKRKS